MDNICDKYAFIGEWFDHHTSTTKKFLIHYFPSDSSVDLYDMKNRKTFLRRTPIAEMAITDFYIGGVIKVFGRKIHIVDFGSEDTRKRLEKAVEKTFAMFKPETNDKIGEIIECILNRGFKITQLRMTTLTKDSALNACRSLREDQNLESILGNINSGPVIVMELIGENVYEKWSKDIYLSPADPSNNGAIRRTLGKENENVVFYAPSSTDESLQDLSYFFPTGKLKSLIPAQPATLSNCTCCVVKPHAIREGNLGKITKAITDGDYKITTMKMFYMENSEAAEFYEVYKGVIPEYTGMVSELSSGPCVAMEVVGSDGMNTPVEFRKLVGPHDPEIAKQLRPHTLRARFGSSSIQNAVHCSDLPEDGQLEVEYFFKIME